MGKFGLDLHPEKTRLIEFGRYAAERREKNEEGKPETFNFLGFTHICGKSLKGKFLVMRNTITKRLRAKLQEIKEELMTSKARANSSSWNLAKSSRAGLLQLSCSSRKHIPFGGL